MSYRLFVSGACFAIALAFDVAALLTKDPGGKAINAAALFFVGLGWAFSLFMEGE